MGWRVLRPGGLLVAANGGQHLRHFWAAVQRPTHSPIAPNPDDVLLPVTISPEQASALAQSYGLEFRPPAPFADTLRLSIQIIKMQATKKP